MKCSLQLLQGFEKKQQPINPLTNFTAPPPIIWLETWTSFLISSQVSHGWHSSIPKRLNFSLAQWGRHLVLLFPISKMHLTRSVTEKDIFKNTRRLLHWIWKKYLWKRPTINQNQNNHFFFRTYCTHFQMWQLSNLQEATCKTKTKKDPIVLINLRPSTS